MIKVSIITPVYNTENFLDRYFESMINQTLNDIEIIVIDDGSTDNSLAILKEYASKDSRIKVLAQENSKQGAARNKGLDIAQGEFVTFVDSDDWVSKNYLEELYNACIEMDVNMAAASMVRDKKRKSRTHVALVSGEVLRGASNIIKGIDNHFETAGKLYKRKLIQDLRFQEGVLYEDGGFTIRAINLCGSCVTVASVLYHYVSNPKSTIKQKLSIKNENDKIETSLDLINYAKDNNIKIKEWCIFKDDHFLWAIKNYIDRKDFYLFGIKVFSKTEMFNNEKVFLVFNTACFGDVLLCNSLCQNIKLAFPDSKIVFITDKNWKEVAQYQKDVDEVVVYDKKGVHKGLGGMLKFVREFKYKKPFASFITYRNERNTTIAKLLQSRFVITQNRNDKDTYMPYRHSKLLQQLTHRKIKNLPIKYNLPEGIKNPLEGEKYVALCCITKNPPKDMPIETAIEIINKINTETEYKPVLTGAGELSQQYAEKLEKAGVEFVNLVNKTSLLELGAVLKGSVGLISCDTGTMHLGYALDVSTVAVFYEDKCVPIWSPKAELYNTSTVSKNQTAENIVNELMRIAR